MDPSFFEIRVLQYLHGFLNGEAKCFQTDEVAPDFNNYEERQALFLPGPTRVLAEKTRFDIKCKV